MAKEIYFKGKTLDELKNMSIDELKPLLDARTRRTLDRGFTDAQKRLLLKIDKAIAGKYKKSVKTHCRDMVILPKMIGLTIHVHKGNAFEKFEINSEMIGHRLGELALSRKRIQHSAPGIGATKSSSAASVK